ncbi:MAG: glyoxalase superfamily protein [Acidimicrobiia bacterium]
MTADKDFKQLVRARARKQRTSYASARQRLLATATAPASREDPSMKFTSVVPILRTFDTDRATEFYVDYLGMTVDWEHRFEPDLPLYRQVSRGDLVLHLTEHQGDSTPGSVVYIYMTGVRDLHAELSEKFSVGRNKPGLESADGRTEFAVVDPFGNRLRFGELE